MKVEYLKRLNHTPRLHGNGFIQLDLEGQDRMHIWHPDLLNLAQSTRTPIHDHCFDFKSKILIGNIGHIIYEEEEDDEGNYYVYRALPRNKEDTELVEMERVTIYTEECYLLSTGSSYTFPAFKLHETVVNTPSVSVITKLKRHDGYPRVLCEVGKKPDNQFSRYIDEEILWKFIEQGVKQL